MAWVSKLAEEDERALQAACSESMLRAYNASLNRVTRQILLSSCEQMCRKV